MKTVTITFILTILSSLGLHAQNHGDQEISRRIQNLDALIGQWEGEGYIIDSKSREKVSFTQTEEVIYELDSTIISVEGIGTSEGKIVHHARAIISVSDSTNQFDFYSFMSDGRNGKFLMKQEGEVIHWFIDVPQGQLRYTITIKDNNYHEIGEFGQGGNWYPFMEMNLKKKKS